MVRINFLHISFGIAVNQPGNSLLYFTLLSLNYGQVFSFFLGNIEPALILLLQTLPILQKVTDFLPDPLFQQIGPHLTVITKSFTTKAKSIGTNTAIISIISFFAFGLFRANRLPVISIAALGANQQALKQISSTALALASPLAVLLELVLNGIENSFIDQGWDRNGCPFFGRSVVSRDGSAGLQEAPVLRSQPGAECSSPGFPEGRTALVRWILESPTPWIDPRWFSFSASKHPPVSSADGLHRGRPAPHPPTQISAERSELLPPPLHNAPGRFHRTCELEIPIGAGNNNVLPRFGCMPLTRRLRSKILARSSRQSSPASVRRGYPRG